MGKGSWLKIPAKWIFWLIRLFFRIWNKLALSCQGAGTVLFLSRSSLLISGVAFLLLALFPQGHEIGHKVTESRFWFYFPVVVCSLYSWLWARVILDQEFGRILSGEHQKAEPDKYGSGAGISVKHLKFWTRWLPRLVGIVPSAGAAYAVWKAHNEPHSAEPDILDVWIAIGICVGVLVFVTLRRPTLAWLLGGGENKKNKLQQVRGFVVPTSNDGDANTMPALMKAVLLLGFGVPFAFMLFGLWCPATLGMFMGASTSFFIATTFAVSFLSFFVFGFNRARKRAVITMARESTGKNRANRRFHFPVITIGLLGSIVLPIFFDKDRYAVRTITPGKPANLISADSRPDFDTAFSNWITKSNPDKDGVYDMVIVATAGGALRAATWTGAILAKLDESIPGFHEHLFAISGVSGGSLGAAAYLAAKKERKIILASKNCVGFDKMPTLRNRLIKGLSGDYLGPVVLGLLSNDLFLIGLGSVKVFETVDRAQALEQAWEKGWHYAHPTCLTGKQTSSEGIFAEQFLKLWKPAEPWPIFLLNGTHQQLGNRIITSNIKIKGAFVDAIDFFDLRPDPVAVSTAVHNSARFSYVSPSGKISRNNNIVDGGYFENYGAETALDVIRNIEKYQAQLKSNSIRQIKGISIRYHLIQIVSDPEIARAAFNKIKTDNDIRQAKSWWLEQWLGPVQGVLATRGARGMHAAKRLKRKVKKQDYYLFNMGGEKGDGGPALSWYMPKTVRDALIGRLDTPGSHEAKTIDRMKKNLAHLKTNSQSN